MKLGFIGTGNLATAVIKGILAVGTADSKDVYIYDISAEKTAAMSADFGVNVLPSAKDVAATCDVITVAVKPKDIAALFEEISGEIVKNDPLVISTAAGTTLDYISALLPQAPRLVRIMPNINAAVGQAMTAYCATKRVSADDLDFVCRFCSSFGKAMQLDEQYFSVFTAEAGSAPAFVYLFIDALAKASQRHGLTREQALQIAVQTVYGSAMMIDKSGEDPGALAVKVCSPGGTTIEGVAALKEHDLDAMMIDAVDRTAQKDKKLQK